MDLTTYRLIKIKSSFSGARLDDKFITFGVSSCVMVPVPISAWLVFAKFLVEIILAIIIRC